MNATIERQRIATDSQGGLSYGAEVILGDLVGKPHGKCPCHIVGTTGLPESLVFEFLAELLANEWISIDLPSDAREDLRQLSQATAQQLTQVSAEPFAIWESFFRRLGDSEVAPRYFVRLTRLGAQVLSRHAA